MKHLLIGCFFLAFMVYSCGDIILVENITNNNIILLAPSNTATVSAGDVSFNWEALEGADNYLIQIATPNFANANQIVLDTLVSTTKFIQSLEVNTYEWRVKGVNSAYGTNYSTNNFKVE